MDAHIGGVEGRVEALSEGVEVALRVASVKCKIQVLNRSKSKIYRRDPPGPAIRKCPLPVALRE